MLHAAAFLDSRFKDLDPFIPETLEMLELTEQATSEEETKTQSPPPTKRSKLGNLNLET